MTDIQLTKPTFIKVKDIERGKNGYNVIVAVLKAERKDVDTKDGKKIPMVQAKVGDETGCSNAFFKGDDALNITEGKVIAIRNGVKKLLKGHISL
jgi:ssDNA-binding replication factor A large subunit